MCQHGKYKYYWHLFLKGQLRLLPTLVGLLVLPCTPPPPQCRRSRSPLFSLSRKEEPVKTGTCACGRCALQQLALNVHVKHSYQVRSECLSCTFRASCCSARLSRAQISDIAGSSVRDKTLTITITRTSAHNKSVHFNSLL